jgi:hypothetical protein
MTQMRGEGGQDSLSFRPARQPAPRALAISSVPDRHLGRPVTERYKDLKRNRSGASPRGRTLKTDIAAFNAVAAKTGSWALLLSDTCGSGVPGSGVRFFVLVSPEPNRGTPEPRTNRTRTPETNPGTPAPERNPRVVILP